MGAIRLRPEARQLEDIQLGIKVEDLQVNHTGLVIFIDYHPK